MHRRPGSILILCLFLAALPQSTSAQAGAEAAGRQQAVQGGLRRPALRPEVLADILRIERFARLDLAEQSNQLESFYPDAARQLSNPFFEGMFSTMPPADLFQVAVRGRPFGTVEVSQSLVALTGTDFGYDIHDWGPQNPNNAQAIEKFRQWIASNMPSALAM